MKYQAYILDAENTKKKRRVSRFQRKPATELNNTSFLIEQITIS